MAVWDELKVVLARLRDQQPGALMQYPTPDVDEDRQSPFAIRLAPWAAATAEELHQQFGDDIELTVGTLPLHFRIEIVHMSQLGATLLGDAV